MSTIIVQIPPGYTPLVHPGDHVQFDTPLANRVSEGETTAHQVVPLARILKFAPSKVFKYLKVNIGDVVHRGDTVASKDTVFTTKKYIADIEGTLVSVNHHTGEVTIDPSALSSEQDAISALARGTVSACDSASVTLKISKSISVKLSAPIQDRCGGEILFVDTRKAADLTLPDAQGRIIVAHECSPYALAKIEALGTSWIILAPADTYHSPRTLQLAQDSDMRAIIDFAATAVYANAGEQDIVFYT